VNIRVQSVGLGVVAEMGGGLQVPAVVARDGDDRAPRGWWTDVCEDVKHFSSSVITLTRNVMPSIVMFPGAYGPPADVPPPTVRHVKRLIIGCMIGWWLMRGFAFAGCW
jgi:hypothetical protein